MAHPQAAGQAALSLPGNDVDAIAAEQSAGARTCRSCGHAAPPDDFIPDRKVNWEVIPASFVCRDADACFERWLARERAGRDT